MNISIIGCGYVGLVTGSCLAELGHNVLGIDNDPRKLACLQNNSSPIYEPGLEELIRINCQEKRLRFSGSIAEGVQHGQIIFICVNTPPRPDGSLDLSYVEAVSKEIAENLQEYRLIVEKSTVPVRTGEWVSKTIREFVRNDVDFDIASNPEFLREGTAIDDFMRPDRVVIGTDSQRAASLLVSLYEPLNAPLLLTDIKSAELIKHSANAFLAMKISFINSVAQICSMTGADIKRVAKGIGLDKRIGLQAMEAGIGYGGMCLPKDVAAFIEIAKDMGYDFELLQATEKVNHQQRLWPVQTLRQHFSTLQGLSIAILGLSFKPNTDDLRFAASMEIISILQQEKAHIYAYDPKALKKACQANPYITACSSAYEACTHTDAAIICTEWPEFRSLDMAKLRQLMHRPLIIDGRNIYEPERIAKHGFEYFCIGRSHIPPVSPQN
ncbi:MAG: UDP-glucose/GDP-mannose dehydrogenase family protein [bacterium]|nr:UDP-glucose/GDP-mannose dehydrogenase family protein [bacterium]